MTTVAELFRQDGLRAIRSGSLERARQCFEQSAASATSEADATRAMIHLASVEIFSGDGASAARQLPSIVFARGDSLNVWLASYYYANSLIDNGQPEAAQKYIDILFEAAPLLPHPHYRLSLAYDVACAAALAKRSFRKAAEQAHRAAEEIGLCDVSEEVELAAAAIQHNLGYALLGCGKLADAIFHLRSSLARFEAADMEFDREYAYVNLAFVSVIIGALDDADRYLDDAERWIHKSSSWLQRYLFLLRGELAQRRGDLAKAEMHYEQLQQIYPELNGLATLLMSVDLLPLLMPERA